MKIDVAMSKDLTRFSGSIDDKKFDYSVEEFLNLMGAFQQVAAQAQGVELKEEDIISAQAAANEQEK